MAKKIYSLLTGDCGNLGLVLCCPGVSYPDYSVRLIAARSGGGDEYCCGVAVARGEAVHLVGDVNSLGVHSNAYHSLPCFAGAENTPWKIKLNTFYSKKNFFQSFQQCSLQVLAEVVFAGDLDGMQQYI